MANQLFHYKGCGLKNIYLRNGFTVKKTSYGEAVSIHNVEELHKVIGLDLICSKSKLSGEEIRFLRKELDWSQSVLAGILGVSESTIRGWENDRSEITKTADAVLRALYREHVDGDGKIKDLIERISKIDREMHERKIELEETDIGWKKAAA